MKELEQLLSDLVSINSINPDLVPGSPGEGADRTLYCRLVESSQGWK